MNNKAVQAVIWILLALMIGLAVYNRQQLPVLALVAITAFTAALLLPILMARFGRGRALNVEILRQELKNNPDLLLLDVRDAEEYQDKPGHIQGSVNIPLQQLAQHISDIDSHQNKPVAIICTTDRRSKKASRLLTGSGFPLVYVVKGGIKRWHKMGYPLAQNHTS